MLKKNKNFALKHGTTDNFSSGITVVEILISFVIICLIVGVSINYANKIIFDNKVQTSKENIVTLRSNIISVFSGNSNDYIGLTKASAIKANVYPQEMLQEDNLVKNIWGGEVLIHPTGEKNRGFVIGLKDVPQKACVHLVNIKGFDRIKINKKPFKEIQNIVDFCSQLNTISYYID